MLQFHSEEIGLCSALMATLSHLPSLFCPLSPHKHSVFDSPFLTVTHRHHQQFHQLCYRPPPRKHFAICCTSIRKSRASRKVMSDVDLCNELREFISSVGFPGDHVPSMKELSQNGRKDLSHIVRRRGYKLIRELLANSRETDIDESDLQRNLLDKGDTMADCVNGTTGQDEKVDNFNLDEHVSLSTEDPVMNSSGGSVNVDPVMNTNERSIMYVESSSVSALQEKVAKFIQNGELDMFEDYGYDILNESSDEIGKGNIELDKAVETESKTPGEELPENLSSESNDAALLNGSTLTSEQIAPPATENNPLRDDFLATEVLMSDDSDSNLDVEVNERENQVELNHLKFMLHQKELELFRLKEQIEKEKLALSALQIKAEAEISKAQKLVSEKNEELQAAEESLLGLKEVQIQYRGDGEIVEVAGSFNGWHHRVKLDPEPSSAIIDPTGSRKSRLWSTVLWLYPGEYEIKFVVDGQWKIDPQKESITRGTIHNNILRVDR